MKPVIKILLLTALLAAMPAPFAASQYVRQTKIVMLWDYISENGDDPDPEMKAAYGGLDVVSPTWFSIGNAKGDVSSLADREYIKWAHENGIKVWAVFENKSNNLLTLTTLLNIYSRAWIIDQIAEYVREFDIDGINIDFEALKGETGKYFELFIIELYKKLNPLGITLSVDIPFPPGEIGGIYDINLIANNSDYIVLMAYDQHHVESDLPGPVAAIHWVRQGIEDTLQYVSGDRLILGIPFYTRVWTENRKGNRLRASSEIMGMKKAYELFDRSSIIWGRDRSTEQIYSEFIQDQAYRRAWLEDEHSISLKLDVIIDYELAGLSAWRRGWEWDETWDLINAYFE